MIILGLDPGTATTGYGIVRCYRHNIQGICFGTITTTPDMRMSRRLNIIFDELNQIIDRYKPDEVAIEKLFFGRNITTAISVGQARGVLMLQAERNDLPIGEYTPMEVKQALVGYGHADKKQVQHMVAQVLKLKEIPRPDDAADALAIAICHAHFRGRRFLG